MDCWGILGETTTRKCEPWVVKDTKIRDFNSSLEKSGLNRCIRLESKGRRIHRPEHLIETESFGTRKEFILNLNSIILLIKCAWFCLMEWVAKPEFQVAADRHALIERGCSALTPGSKRWSVGNHAKEAMPGPSGCSVTFTGIFLAVALNHSHTKKDETSGWQLMFYVCQHFTSNSLMSRISSWRTIVLKMGKPQIRQECRI